MPVPKYSNTSALTVKSDSLGNPQKKVIFLVARPPIVLSYSSTDTDAIINHGILLDGNAVIGVQDYDQFLLFDLFKAFDYIESRRIFFSENIYFLSWLRI